MQDLKELQAKLMLLVGIENDDTNEDSTVTRKTAKEEVKTFVKVDLHIILH